MSVYPEPERGPLGKREKLYTERIVAQGPKSSNISKTITIVGVIALAFVGLLLVFGMYLAWGHKTDL